MGLATRFAEFIRWYPRGMSAEERRLVAKIDWLVLVYACLSFFTKYLDVSALSNAYVSGMKEDLNLKGNRLNYINAAYEVGYVVFQVPSNILVTRIPAHYYLPAVEIFWGLFTLGTAFITNYHQLVVMRFFVGLSSTACYIGCLHVINSWYKRNELGRRNALFWCANPLGTMFAGYLQAAAYKHLNGHRGLESWRWLFIICTIITIPISLIGFIFFPDIPERTKTRWLTQREKELACNRVEADGFKRSLGLNRGLIARVLKIKEFYIFVPLTVIFFTCLYGYNTPFLLWLKSQHGKYSIPMVNNLGTVSSAVSVVSAIAISYYTDLSGSRWEAALFAGFICLFSNIVLAVWHIPYGLKFYAYVALGAAHGVGPLLVTWTAEALAGDLETRSIVFAVQNTFGEVAGLVVPLVAWRVSHSPTFHGGFIWAACISGVFMLNVGVITIYQRRKKQQQEPPISEEAGNELSKQPSEEVKVVEETKRKTTT